MNDLLINILTYCTGDPS